MFSIGDRVVISGGGQHRPTGTVTSLHRDINQHGNDNGELVVITWRSGSQSAWNARDVILESDWLDGLGNPTWVVWNVETGYSDESMRFSTRSGAEDFIEDSTAFPEMYAIRFED